MHYALKEHQTISDVINLILMADFLSDEDKEFISYFKSIATRFSVDCFNNVYYIYDRVLKDKYKVHVKYVKGKTYKYAPYNITVFAIKTFKDSSYKYISRDSWDRDLIAKLRIAVSSYIACQETM